jgi:hypothetical protein
MLDAGPPLPVPGDVRYKRMSNYPNGPSESYEVMRGEDRWLVWAAVAGIIALFVLFGLMGAQGTDDPPEQVAVADVADGSETVAGESVSIEGEVDEFLTEQTMTVSDTQSSESLLVLVPQTAVVNGLGPAGGMAATSQFLPPAGAGSVQVLGTVEPFDGDAMAEVLGIVLNEEFFESWEGDRVLVADRIDTFIDQ